MIGRLLHKCYLDGFVLALAAMLVVGILVPTSGQAADFLRATTKVAIGLVFFIHGIRLSSEQLLAGARQWRLHLTLLIFTFAVYPMVGLGVGALTGELLPRELATGLVYLTLVPATIQACVSYTAIARGNVAAAVVAATASNLLGVLLTPLLVAAVLGTTGAAPVDLSTFVAVVGQLLVPFFLGQLVRPRVRGFLQRHDAQLKYVDQASILMIVFSAFSAGTAAGIWDSVTPSRFAVMAGLCVLLLTAAFTATSATGKCLRFPREDRIALMFVGSSKALGTGLSIATVIFPASEVALIILPLMMFHMLTLIVSAVIAQRLSRQRHPGPPRSTVRNALQQ